MSTLFYRPGELGTIVFETFDSDGVRADGYPEPVISRVIKPPLVDGYGNVQVADGYPQAMTRLDTGLFYYKFILPSGASGIGTYILDVYYNDPIDDLMKTVAYKVISQSVSGNIGLKASS